VPILEGQLLGDDPAHRQADQDGLLDAELSKRPGAVLNEILEAIAAPRSPLQAVDGEVVEDGEHPGPCIAFGAMLVPAADHALQTVLHQVVGGCGVAQQGPRVTLERRDQGSTRRIKSSLMTDAS